MDVVLKPGHLVDERYELVRRLGSGGVGVVWLAQDRTEGRPVALKLLHAKLVHDQHAIRQIKREAQVLDQLAHPNIARMFAFVIAPPTVYLTIEFVDGQPLQEVIGEHTKANTFFRHEEVLDLFEQLCSAVIHAHGKGIVHRDLKPHNVMVVRDGPRRKLKVLDFGIARLLQGSLFDATTFGRQLGSLFYMSPEQTRGEPADVRSDVFGLGVILYELLTLHRAWARLENGRPVPAFRGPVPPGPANALAAVFTRLSVDERPRPSQMRPAVVAFDRLIVQALAVDPDERFQTVEALLDSAKRAFGSLSDPRTEMLPESDSFEDETRIERQADDSRTQIAAEFGDLSEAGPTDKAKRDIPETDLYTGAAAGDLEEAGPTVASEEPLMVTASQPRSYVHTESVGQPAPAARAPQVIDRPAESVVTVRPPSPIEPNSPTVPPADTWSLDRTAAPTQELPPTSEMETQRLRWPMVAGVFLLALSIAAIVTMSMHQPEARNPDKKRVVAPPPPPKPAYDFAEIDGLLARVKANPEDTTASRALSAQIAQAAQRVEDPEERGQIEKIAELSSLVHNVEGLESAVERLKAALR